MITEMNRVSGQEKALKQNQAGDGVGSRGLEWLLVMATEGSTKARGKFTLSSVLEPGRHMPSAVPQRVIPS